MTTDARLTLSWSLLRYAYGAVIVLAGLDKVFATNLITNWAGYISAPVLALLPFPVSVFLMGMGIIEVVVGIMLLWKYTKIASYITIAWLLIISINLLMGGFIDVAIRDILLAIGAYVMAELTMVVTSKEAHLHA